MTLSLSSSPTLPCAALAAVGAQMLRKLEEPSWPESVSWFMLGPAQPRTRVPSNIYVSALEV
ncbi:hypothetical protein C2857_007649 [Epichloe festucae Fl1]|uniref:Uncharacterized protein n=1 Tax=Epichloe festucae (strain Fl1) TaxID=877507 RepID=A0A7S9KQZ7_EPIFF|nr:hypothetical protein C2857_007649 [Epichloe festucae Fl1]